MKPQKRVKGVGWPAITTNVIYLDEILLQTTRERKTKQYLNNYSKQK